MPDWEEGNVVYMRILEDLRYIGVFERLPVSEKWPWQSLCVWMDSVLRCSYKLGGFPMIRTFFFEGEGLMFDVTNHEIKDGPVAERKLYRCRPISVKDLPEGLEEQFSRAVAKEWI